MRLIAHAIDEDGEYTFAVQVDETDANEIKITALESWKNGDQLDSVYLDKRNALFVANAIIQYYSEEPR